MELDCLSLLQHLSYRQSSSAGIDANDVAYQEVAERGLLIELVHGDAQEERMPRELPVMVTQIAKESVEYLQRWPAAQLDQKVSVASRYMHRFPDGPTTLGDNRLYGYVSTHCYAYGALPVDLIAQKQRVAVRPSRSTGQAADLHTVREGVVEPHKQMLTPNAKRIGHEDEVGLVRGPDSHQTLPYLRPRVSIREFGVRDVKR